MRGVRRQCARQDPVGDSKDPYGPVVVFPAVGWAEFTAVVRGSC
ncbi:DUF397 domain-containing protein [Streptomyces sp. MST-110588]|nr:DUF397 domain-containing protein [Streptomyces sp. MST-110588]